MSRIAERFREIRSSQRTGIVTYVTAGDPDLDDTEELLIALDDAGADILEVGIPFSDPLADGPVIQRAAERALLSGTTLTSALARIGRIRHRLSAPVVLFSYANPILRMGLERFRDAAGLAGIDGVLVLDVPVEETSVFKPLMNEANIDTIFLVSPTTTDERLVQAASLGSGFLYAISRLGVTGARDQVSTDARVLVERIRRVSNLPVAVGFGISRREHVVEVGRFAEAAVVGSALVSAIAESDTAGGHVDRAVKYIRWLKGEVEALSV